jgi:hypothetical protein
VAYRVGSNDGLADYVAELFAQGKAPHGLDQLHSALSAARGQAVPQAE